MIRVVLVDDQAVVRAGFRYLLEQVEDIEVVAEASDGPTAVELVRRHAPDVVCMDVRMPGGDGLAATRQIVAGPGAVPAVLVVTTFDLDEYVFGALEAGAGGFILKDCEPEELVDAVRRLADGQGLIDQAVTHRVITEFARRTAPPAPATDLVAQLTAREAEIVRQLARGLSNAEIARELVVETSTVKSHLGRAMAKIGTRDRLQTVVWAYQNGLAAR
ncbi:response regulator [Promicromonospora thailandica]|uniref:DNA-binding response regulator, NarL/FixJ family, contains REC and HTH domains n=1 Tax=Promicromonospora thailandica TaxID=765201 RepID=A0A9X2G1U5_9MICO|nr:response regulator transcription factor [Promicromonospora thailandica]MCP2263742.1 DNA-binding response regulator, NarL/FixJ family, contains REC and HTH domains [Promicromonospora thailandica]BFF17973.1 response regulator transcription factor [Promicromonospora thailandica]